PGLLELDREKEGGGNINPLDLCALRFGCAVINLANPKTLTRSVRFAIKKINVMLAHKECRLVNRVYPISAVRVVNKNICSDWSPQGREARIRETDGKTFSTFAIDIVNQRNVNLLEGLARRKFQRSHRSYVVASR